MRWIKKLRDGINRQMRMGRRRDVRFIFDSPMLGVAQDLHESNNWRPISIVDLGARGMRIKSEFDFPMNKEQVLKFVFEIENKVFDLQGKLCWRKEADETFFGIQFIDLTNPQQQKLANSLIEYQTNHGAVLKLKEL